MTADSSTRGNCGWNCGLRAHRSSQRATLCNYQLHRCCRSLSPKSVALSSFINRRPESITHAVWSAGK